MIKLEFKEVSPMCFVAYPSTKTDERYFAIDFDFRGFWCLEYVENGQVSYRHTYSCFTETEILLILITQKGFEHNLQLIQMVRDIYDPTRIYDFVNDVRVFCPPTRQVFVGIGVKK